MSDRSFMVGDLAIITDGSSRDGSGAGYHFIKVGTLVRVLVVGEHDRTGEETIDVVPVENDPSAWIDGIVDEFNYVRVTHLRRFPVPVLDTIDKVEAYLNER